MHSTLVRNFTGFPCTLFVLCNKKLTNELCLIPTNEYRIVFPFGKTIYTFVVIQGWNIAIFDMENIPLTLSIFEILKFQHEHKKSDNSEFSDNSNEYETNDCYCVPFYVRTKTIHPNRQYNINVKYSYCHCGKFPDYITELI